MKRQELLFRSSAQLINLPFFMKIIPTFIILISNEHYCFALSDLEQYFPVDFITLMWFISSIHTGQFSRGFLRDRRQVSWKPFPNKPTHRLLFIEERCRRPQFVLFDGCFSDKNWINGVQSEIATPQPSSRWVHFLFGHHCLAIMRLFVLPDILLE